MTSDASLPIQFLHVRWDSSVMIFLTEAGSAVWTLQGEWNWSGLRSAGNWGEWRAQNGGLDMMSRKLSQHGA